MTGKRRFTPAQDDNRSLTLRSVVLEKARLRGLIPLNATVTLSLEHVKLPQIRLRPPKVDGVERGNADWAIVVAGKTIATGSVGFTRNFSDITTPVNRSFRVKTRPGDAN